MPETSNAVDIFLQGNAGIVLICPSKSRASLKMLDPAVLQIFNHEHLNLDSQALNLQRSMPSSATVSFLAAQRSMLQWFGRPRARLGHALGDSAFGGLGLY